MVVAKSIKGAGQQILRQRITGAATIIKMTRFARKRVERTTSGEDP